MAGMDWFRWHHGSVTDPKFQLVAKKAGASVAEVIAVWASLLEAASQAEQRGNPGELDFESIDCSLGLDDGKSQAIYSRMRERGLFTEDGSMEAWDRRQPKREREDNSAGRMAAKRERDAKQNHVTPSDASDDQKKPRGEERREEEISPSLRSGEDARPTTGEACLAMKAAGMANVSPSNPKLKALLDAGITLGELADAARDAVADGKPFAYALATAEGRRRDAARVGSLPNARASPEPTWRTEQRERTQLAAPGVAAQPADQFFIDVETKRVPAISVD